MSILNRTQCIFAKSEQWKNLFLAEKKSQHYNRHEVKPMKLSAAIEGMLHMCPAAWKILLRCLQLSCFLLFLPCCC